MSLTTPTPLRVTCAVSTCRQEVYPHQMATKMRWEVEDRMVLSKEPRYTTWCGKCEKACHASHAEGKAIYLEILDLYETWLREAWDGVTMQQCVACKVEKPVTSFGWRSWAKARMASRHQACIHCKGTRKGRVVSSAERMRIARTGTADAPKTPMAPFDVIQRRIEARTGLKIEDWTQHEHEAHCILMRDMCGIPHHVKREVLQHPRRVIDPGFHEQGVKRWNLRLHSVQRWMNYTEASHNASTPLSNA